MPYPWPVRVSLVLGLVLGLSVSANAATLSLESDQATYAVNDTIVLTVAGTATRADEDKFAFARLLFDEVRIDAIAASQTPHTRGGADVSTGTLAFGDGFGDVLNQVWNLNPTTVDPGMTVGTLTLIAQSAGTATVFYQADGGAATLNYFGITNQPGISFLIVPEPASVALVGLGLGALALARRRSGPVSRFGTAAPDGVELKTPIRSGSGGASAAPGSAHSRGRW